MQKAIGSHKVIGRNGGSKTTAVLECGHEVDYGAVKWPESMAECPKKCAMPAAAAETSAS